MFGTIEISWPPNFQVLFHHHYMYSVFRLINQVLKMEGERLFEEFSAGYYGLCTAGGMLSAGITHLAITPLDVLKVNMQVITLFNSFFLTHLITKICRHLDFKKPPKCYHTDSALFLPPFQNYFSLQPLTIFLKTLLVLNICFQYNSICNNYPNKV